MCELPRLALSYPPLHSQLGLPCGQDTQQHHPIKILISWKTATLEPPRVTLMPGSSSGLPPPHDFPQFRNYMKKGLAEMVSLDLNILQP